MPAAHSKNQGEFMEEEKPRKGFEIPKPVAVGDAIDVTIESLGGQGDGIAKVEEFVIFVKGTTKGEKCKIRITGVKRTYATAEKISSVSEDAEKIANMEEQVEPVKDGPAG